MFLVFFAEKCRDQKTARLCCRNTWYSAVTSVLTPRLNKPGLCNSGQFYFWFVAINMKCFWDADMCCSVICSSPFKTTNPGILYPMTIFDYGKSLWMKASAKWINVNGSYNLKIFNAVYQKKFMGKLCVNYFSICERRHTIPTRHRDNSVMTNTAQTQPLSSHTKLSLSARSSYYQSTLISVNQYQQRAA